MPAALNPETKTDGFNLRISIFRSDEKTFFGRFSFLLDSHLKISQISFHSIFASWKARTSSGWQRWVAFRGWKIKRNPCSKQARITFVEKYDPRLSPTRITSFPLWWRMDGKNCLKIQISNVQESNRPFNVQSQTQLL